MTEEIIIAIPNKGRLKEPIVKLLEAAGIRRAGDDRVYLSTTNDASIKLLSVRAADIPVYVYHGIADVGITGRDIIAETSFQDLYELADLASAHAAWSSPWRRESRTPLRRR